MSDDGQAVTRILDALPPTDQQSLFVFRIVSAQYSYSQDELSTYFRKSFKTDWLQKRFLFPLIFTAINNPPEINFDQFISYVVSGEEHECERSTITFLLRDDLFSKHSLSFKLYTALLCHPYDASEIVINHAESVIAIGEKPNFALTSLLRQIATAAPMSRAGFLLQMIEGAPVQWSAETTPPFCSEVDEQAGFALSAFASMDPMRAELNVQPYSKPIRALLRMRQARYPTNDDFDYIVTIARAWWFTSAGRLIHILLSTLYMVDRKPRAHEYRDLIRAVQIFGSLGPFTASSPSGVSFLKWMETRGQIISYDQIKKVCDAAIASSGQYNDRCWIKATHWHGQSYIDALQIRLWLKHVRKDIRIAPAFLTGIDWEWFDNIIKQTRLTPFISNNDAAYVFLLREVEQRLGSEALRITIEPLIQNLQIDDVISTLRSEFGNDTVAFARYLLTPETLLVLGISSNRVAAIADRIKALRECVRAGGYTDVLPESLFKQEWDTLSAELMLLSVNAGQFEIPWTMFQRDAAAKQIDLYTAARRLQPDEELAPILSDARTTNPYKFRNGRLVHYSYPNRLTPLASLTIAVIEDFLEHPGYGLEVILSTRFRHDTMRREFVRVIDQVGEAPIPTVLANQKQGIIRYVAPSVLKIVDGWLDRYAHTKRPGRPDGLFDLIPEPAELLSLLERMRPNDGADATIEVVVNWLRERLISQLPAAAAKFQENLSDGIDTTLHSSLAELSSTSQYRTSDIEKVGSALKATLFRHVEELGNWFSSPQSVEHRFVTFNDIRRAADALFDADRSKRGYCSYLSSPGTEAADQQFDAAKVRLVFDLLAELFGSTIKYSGSRVPRVRVTAVDMKGVRGFRFSNLTNEGDPSTWQVSGDPYKSLDDVIFREGNSGLAKIAALSASILGEAATITIHRRKNSFHVDVPLWSRSDKSANGPVAPSVLVVEDSEPKWLAIRDVVALALPKADIARSSALDEANSAIANRDWDLVVLDISMTIRAGEQRIGAGGHDATGGLRVAERIFYLGKTAPVVVVTAFDAFPSGAGRRDAILGLEDITSRAEDLLGTLFLGTVRYGDPGWETRLADIVRGIC